MALTDPALLPAALDRIEAFLGKPKRLPPRKALDWILWENCAYLVNDEKRAKAYRALADATKLRAVGILALPRSELLALARLGGMIAEKRVEKLLAIAHLVQDEHGGDLEAALALPLAKARRAMKRFPGIGDPGADKILLFTGTHALPALESNGLRALVRLGYAREETSYARMYRTGVAALAPHAERGCAWLMRAYDVLRAHGQRTCTHNAPACDACMLAEECPSA